MIAMIGDKKLDLTRFNSCDKTLFADVKQLLLKGD